MKTKRTKRMKLLACIAPVVMAPMMMSPTAHAQVADEREDRGRFYEDDAWYDVSEWFDGNDYNPTDEAIGRWDNEVFEYHDALTSSDEDSDGDWIDSEEFYGEDYDDGYARFADNDRDQNYETYSRYYDSDNDRLYDSHVTYYDRDRDGTYDEYDFNALSHTPDNAVPSSEIGNLNGKPQTIDGQVAETKVIKRLDRLTHLAHIKGQDGKSLWVDLGEDGLLLQVYKGDELTATGPADNIEYRDVETPEVTPGHVLVKVHACGVGYRDIIERRGDHPFMQTPMIQGHEFAGEVVEVGEGVKRWALGDRVINLYTDSCGSCEQCLGGDERRCSSVSEAYGLLTHGGYADYVLVAERGLERLHDQIDYTTGATLMSAVGVGFHNTINTAAVRLGDNVLVTGASGGVGLAALQTAKMLGATVWAVTSSEDKVEALKQAGADHVLVNRDGKFHKQLLAERGNVGVDVAIDCVGTPTINGSLRSLRPYGAVVVVGNVEGGSYQLNLGMLAVNALRILGSDNITRASLRKAMALVAEGKLTPVIAKTFPLSEAAEAHRQLEQRAAVGRYVLLPQ